MIKLKISPVAEETGALLREYLETRKCFNYPGDADICYGVPSATCNNLNGNCGTSKIERLELMQQAGVPTVPWFSGLDIPKNFRFPGLARKTYGYGGLDIIPVFQPEEIPWRLDAGYDWFSEYIPIQTEYRVWVFRDKHLDTYEKVMRRTQDYRYIGRNFRNGFDFEYTTNTPLKALEAALDTVKSLGLDFGAVDMIRGKDNRIYILECNTAPGVIKSGAQATLAKLADYMRQWVKEGFPTR